MKKIDADKLVSALRSEANKKYKLAVDYGESESFDKAAQIKSECSGIQIAISMIELGDFYIKD